ncbi:MAG: hypothetical protein PHF24_01435 [Syntrophomonas sp.]|nr:hypothetical protein [Syntrophomonas sp.]
MEMDSGMDAILSSFIRYTELSAIKYDAQKDVIKIEAALNGCINEQQSQRFIAKYNKSTALYHSIKGIQPGYMDLEFIEQYGITILRLYRESQTLQEEEIELFVLLLRQEFVDLLMKEENDMLAQAALTEDIKVTVMKKIKQLKQPCHNIFVYRDKGRVFVFNR